MTSKICSHSKYLYKLTFGFELAALKFFSKLQVIDVTHNSNDTINYRQNIVSDFNLVLINFGSHDDVQTFTYPILKACVDRA